MVYLIYLPINLVFYIFCLIVNPIVAGWVHMSAFLNRYFWTHDHGPMTENEIKNFWPFLYGLRKGPWRDYLVRLFWMYRNTGYGFAYYVCGMEIVNPVKVNNWYWRADNGAWCIHKEAAWYKVYLGWKFNETSTGRQMLAMNITPRWGGG
jgi:hypothetical protein